MSKMKIMLTLQTIVEIIRVRYRIYGYNLYSIYVAGIVSGTLYTLSLPLTAILKWYQ